MQKQLRSLPRCVWQSIVDTIQHDGIEHAGYLSFLGLLALFPFLVFVVAVLGAVNPHTQAALYVAALFRQLPPDVIRALEPRVTEITSGPPQGLLTLAIVGAIWTASSAVEGLRTILNRAYRVHTPPAYWFRRSLSILQLLVFASVVISAMLLLVAAPVVFARMESWLGMSFFSTETLWWSRFLLVMIPVLLLCAVAWLYYIIPNIRQHWISIWPGALVVVALWLGAVQLFTYYLNNFHQVNLIYGSLGGVIVALVFFYVCNMIFVFGAELNYHISQLFGMEVQERRQTQR